MRAYDTATKLFLEIARKENLTPTMEFVTENEELRIKESLNGEGEVYIENRELIISGSKPFPYQKWDKGSRSWVKDESKFQEWLTVTRNEVWEKIKEKRSTQAYTGIEADGNWFHTDEESLRNYQLCWIRSELPDFNPPMWKTMNGSFVQMSKSLMEKIIARAYDKGQHDFRNAEIHRQALMKSTEPLNYDYSTGWSETFQTV